MRIRTIKPEFWISESMGRLSRDSRLTFIGLWSVADDHGRFRADPRYLAGQLYPYDLAGLEVINEALIELTREHCITLYEADRSRYGVLTGWKSHQKIDRPSASKIPAPTDGQPREAIDFVEGSRGLDEGSMQTREGSCEDQGSGKGSGKGSGSREGSAGARAKKPKAQGELIAPPVPPPALKPPTRIGKIHANFIELREAQFLCPPPHGLGLGEPPPDEPPDWGRSAAALAQWVKRWPDFTEEEQDQAIGCVVLEWLKEPYWASPRDKEGNPTTPYPWGAFVTEKQFDKACAKAFPDEAAA